MKRILLILVAILASFTLLTSFSAKTPVVTETIEVHNSQEFYKSIKSNVNIKLLPGDYDTKSVVKGKYSYFNSKLGDIGANGPTIKNVKNVKVFSDSNVFMYLSEARAYDLDCMLTFVNCSNITFENIAFGRKGTAFGGFFTFYKCKNVEINNCDFSGWSSGCVNTNKSSLITIKNSKLHDSGDDGNILRSFDSKKVTFYKTEIFHLGFDNPYSKLGVINDSDDILLSACNIHDNGAEENPNGVLFADHFPDQKQPTLDQCTLSNNRY